MPAKIEIPPLKMVADKVPPPQPNRYHSGFADGIRFFMARFSYTLDREPVAMNAALVAVVLAERGLRAPDLVDVHWSTKKQAWRAEFERIRRAFAPNGVHVPPDLPKEYKRKAGRPRTDSEESTWTEQ